MSDVTLLLSQIADGNLDARNKLLPLIYDELHRKAASYMRKERVDHTLQATALVHEAYLKLVGNDAIAFQSKAHFYHAAAEAMRRILVDHARAHGAIKRGLGQKRMDLENSDIPVESRDAVDYESLDAALEKLQTIDERRYRVVMLRYFAGLTEQEVADSLGLSLKTVQRDWATAKLYLLGKMQDR